MSLTKVTYSMIDGAVINALDYGADNTGVSDSSTSIQSAIDAATVIGGAQIFFPSGTYRIDTPINLTSSAGNVRAYIQIVGAGNSTVFEGNTGGRLFDCVGSNFLMFRDFQVVATGAQPSNIIFQLARSVGAYNFCHHNRIENVTVNIPSAHTANNNFGTIGLLNVEGEDFSALNFYSSANSPVVLLRAPAAAVLLSLVSYVSIDTVGVSFGQQTFAGKTLMQAWNSWCSPLYIDAVNTCTFENAHFAGGTSPWDADSTGTWDYAIRTGTSNPLVKFDCFGLVEYGPKLLTAQNNLQSVNIDVYVAGTGASASDPLIDIQNHLLVGSNISVDHGDVARRQFMTGAGTIQNCTLTGYNIANRLPAELGVNVENTNYANEQKSVFYGENSANGQKTFTTEITTTAINVSTPGVIVAYVNLPQLVSGHNSGYISVSLNGIVSTLANNSQTAEVSVARYASTVDMVSDKTGTFAVGTPSTTLSTPISGNVAVANLTGITFTAAVVSNVLQITASATASGSSAYTNGINLTGTAVVSWSGFSGMTAVTFG